MRIHDLRRTLGSWQAAIGSNAYIIGKSLGHKSTEATAIYARLSLDPVRESVNRATQAMFLAVEKSEEKQLVQNITTVEISNSENIIANECVTPGKAMSI